MIFLAILGDAKRSIASRCKLSPIVTAVCLFQVVRGRPTIPGLREQVYAITSERRLKHPAIQAISQAARYTLA